MRWVLFVLSLGQFAIALNAAAAERQLREVTIADPFIELHTGPGGGYPVFFVAERGEEIALIRRRTEWFLVRVARGQELMADWLADRFGIDQRALMTKSLNPLI